MGLEKANASIQRSLCAAAAAVVYLATWSLLSATAVLELNVEQSSWHCLRVQTLVLNVSDVLLLLLLLLLLDLCISTQSLLSATAVLKLNGGLGTSMGLEKAKSLLEVKDGKTFLDLIAEQVREIGASSCAATAVLPLQVKKHKPVHLLAVCPPIPYSITTCIFTVADVLRGRGALGLLILRSQGSSFAPANPGAAKRFRAIHSSTYCCPACR
jgi:hypothetical protein